MTYPRSSSFWYWLALSSVPLIALGAIGPWAEETQARISGASDALILALAIVAALTLIIFAGVRRRSLAIIPLVAGAGVAVMTGPGVGDVRATDPDATLSTTWGLYLTVVGAICLVLASLAMVMEEAGVPLVKPRLRGRMASLRRSRPSPARARPKRKPTSAALRERATIHQRLAIVEASRAEARERDAARYELGHRLSIKEARGFAVAPPGSIEAAGPVIEAANTLIDSIGIDSLVTQGQAKGGFIAQGFLPEDAFELDSPYMRFALSDEVVQPVTDYLGIVPILNSIDVWYSFHGGGEAKSSQLWHLDRADVKQVKVWIHASDIDAPSGPLTVLDAAASEDLADRVSYDFYSSYRISDEQVREAAGDSGLVSFSGPTGTVDFVDTSRCFHFGSRVQKGAPARRIFVAQYLTPYAFKLGPDHREKAQFRHLADDTTGQRERLLLGAD
jgi:hypothetical protein